MSEREYDVLVETPLYKSVRVRASSMREARDRLCSNDSEHFVDGEHKYAGEGPERVVDAVRAGEPWHFDR